MMKLSQKLIPIIAMTLGFASANLALADGHGGDGRAAMLSNTCNGCHGPDGSSYGPSTPTIAGLNKGYLAASMKAFKSGVRPNTVMTRIAKGYSDEEIDMIASYFASMEFKRHPQDFDGGLASKGKDMIADTCEKCHENNGLDGEDYPILGGQMVPYIEQQISDYISNRRDLDKNESLSSRERNKKKKALEELSNAGGSSAVANFYGSQTGGK